MQIKAIRLANLERLIETRLDGKKTRLATLLGKQQPYISRLWASNPKQRRNIGDQLARDIEDAFELDPGWLDRLHDPDGAIEGTAVAELARIATALSAPDQAQLVRIAQTFLDRYRLEGLNPTATEFKPPHPRKKSGGTGGTANGRGRSKTAGAGETEH